MQLLTRRRFAVGRSFENAITVLYALGGSTNGVLHMLALAKEAEVTLKIDDFNTIGRDVPMLANLAPSGAYNWADVDALGGLPVVMKELDKHGMIHTDCLTGEQSAAACRRLFPLCCVAHTDGAVSAVTGETVGENLKDVPDMSELR